MDRDLENERSSGEAVSTYLPLESYTMYPSLESDLRVSLSLGTTEKYACDAGPSHNVSTTNLLRASESELISDQAALALA
jgi:hypothetical protein